MTDEANRSALLFALCHEMGNLVGAIRLQTHLLDLDMSPRDLVTARSEIDVLGARVSALLSLVRPLEAPTSLDPVAAPDANDVLAVVEHGLETIVLPGVSVEFVPAETPCPMRIDRGAIQALVTSLAHLAIEQVRPKGRVRIAVERADGRTATVVEDDGPVDQPLASWDSDALRGRTLVCALADRIASAFGGGIVVESNERGSRIAIWVDSSEAC